MVGMVRDQGAVTGVDGAGRRRTSANETTIETRDSGTRHVTRSQGLRSDVRRMARFTVASYGRGSLPPLEAHGLLAVERQAGKHRVKNGTGC